MFENLKKKLSSLGKFEYVVDEKTLEEYLRKELDFTLENNLEACVNILICYKGEKHSLNIWNFSASNFESEQVKGLSVTYDDVEFKSIDNLLNNAIISNSKLIDMKDYFVVQLLDLDSEFLKEYKKNHPELNVEDYK